MALWRRRGVIAGALAWVISSQVDARDTPYWESGPWVVTSDYSPSEPICTLQLRSGTEVERQPSLFAAYQKGQREELELTYYAPGDRSGGRLTQTKGALIFSSGPQDDVVSRGYAFMFMPAGGMGSHIAAVTSHVAVASEPAVITQFFQKLLSAEKLTLAFQGSEGASFDLVNTDAAIGKLRACVSGKAAAAQDGSAGWPQERAAEASGQRDVIYWSDGAIDGWRVDYIKAGESYPSYCGLYPPQEAFRRSSLLNRWFPFLDYRASDQRFGFAIDSSFKPVSGVDSPNIIEMKITSMNGRTASLAVDSVARRADPPYDFFYIGGLRSVLGGDGLRFKADTANITLYDALHQALQSVDFDDSGRRAVEALRSCANERTR